MSRATANRQIRMVERAALTYNPVFNGMCCAGYGAPQQYYVGPGYGAPQQYYTGPGYGTVSSIISASIGGAVALTSVYFQWRMQHDAQKREEHERERQAAAQAEAQAAAAAAAKAAADAAAVQQSITTGAGGGPVTVGPGGQVIPGVGPVAASLGVSPTMLLVGAVAIVGGIFLLGRRR